MSSDRVIGAIRQCRPEDLPELCELVNEIILMGSTTALERPFTVEGFVDHFFNQQIQISCFVAEGTEGELLGFQILSFHEQLPEDWADIATFVRTSPRLSGVGTALFTDTVELADKFEINTLNAVIRADNVGGIAYYEKMGFTTWKVEKDVPLRSGRPVDRIYMRYLVRHATVPHEEIPDEA
jgi:L-amino acid N-acyltransferase YncA